MTVQAAEDQQSTTLAADQRGRSTSSPPEADPATSISAPCAEQSGRHRPLRKPSPGLLARIRLLDQQNKSRVVSSPAFGQDKIGRIPESQIRELDDFHRHHAIQVERRGQAWVGLHQAPQSQPHSRLPMDAAAEEVESVNSSIISTSDRMAPSDSEQSEAIDLLASETCKYRLPEIDKTLSGTQSRTESEPQLDGGAEADEAWADGDRPPTPPPKDVHLAASISGTDTGVSENESNFDYDSYFNPYGLSRAGSIYTLSRVSFTNQLQQLTSIKLPDATSLSSVISAIPTSTAAAKALTDAAEQIRVWMHKASEVLNGLDAEDDVEWAAAGGREGLGEVDAAINRFEALIDVYVGAMEDLQNRSDIGNLQANELKRLVDHMEHILRKWAEIKRTLKGVKEQVEIAMEWEELWSQVLGEIGLELEALSRLVFEMEERRHRTALSEVCGVGENGQGLDIGELETIVEEAPGRNPRAAASSRFSLPPAFPAGSPVRSPSTNLALEDSNLLALFARMQPLRASLDFLPMRLSVFQARGNLVFPTACDELERRREALEEKWKKLEGDAEALRRELGEDRWVLVFRNAGRQALKMCESVSRSLKKLREALDDDGPQNNLPNVAKKIESYEAKKMHYGPAIERVLAIIDRGVKDRLTVNGEILRLQADMQNLWEELQASMRDMDVVIEDLNTNRSQQLRDSISTIISTERSMSNSVIDTPASSPASSVVMMSRKNSDQGPATPQLSKSRQGSFAERVKAQAAANRRLGSLSPSPGGSHIPRKTQVTRSSASPGPMPKPSPGPSFAARLAQSTATPPSLLKRPTPVSVGDRPRWNSSTNMRGTVIGHNFTPLTLTTPSPYKKLPPTRLSRSVSSQSGIPVPSPLGRSSIFVPPSPSSPRRPPSTTPSAGSSSAPPKKPLTFAMGPSPATPFKSPPQRTKGSGSVSSLPVPSVRRPSLQSTGSENAEESPTVRPKLGRPASAMATGASGRRSSMLPQPRGTRTMSGTGRESRAGRNTSLGGEEDRPRWRT